MPEIPEIKDVTDQVARSARDVLYVAVGLSVLGIQRAQVRRQELTKRLGEPRTVIEERLEEVRWELTKQAKVVDDAVEQVIDRIEASWEPIEEMLPPQARELAQQVRTRSREARDYLRNIVINDAA
jgi:methyl coenzyme M reductase subunit C-like uncharacterized protein (methanogenesis marker protein 7)